MTVTTNKVTNSSTVEGTRDVTPTATALRVSGVPVKATKCMMDLIKYPVITEKTYIALYKNRQYTFDVDKRLTKTQIKALFLKLFKVDVISVNTHIPPMKSVRVGIKQGYRPSFKRAIITIKENQSINFNLKANV
jgi:large subunit ribosomal protein L23